MDTMIWTKETIQELIRTNDKAVAKAILALYARQTESERSTEHTQVENGMGFNRLDAPFLTSIAKALPRYGNHMTPRQIAKARPMLLKYWRQLLEIAGEKGAVVETKVRRSIPQRAVDNPLYGAF
ncbi:hypothetical protein [Mesorhizobium sp.]|uniref:hypothetical protein n=1 Tax=Mesorhizobium sp. TaxID=1871066 RepID=UPI000FE3F58F|nr:hypothetical protein [Mesorhizobium sp.]RWI35518.1 MAG: hypothetical protein EOR14_28870 [Mesorhizobium sp.]RWJ03454.1 MAG: hypothetical protein EOR24_32250 [Mesorhizobium sp.]RWJ66313.1 MAG: hypothetical protein EOR34_28265 [Mesorhizobium sp.]